MTYHPSPNRLLPEAAEDASLIYTLTDSSNDADSLRQVFLAPLKTYNDSRAGPSGFEPLVIALRDDDGNPQGGAWGYTAYGWLFVQLMVVPEASRGRGLGRQVMALAEATALQRGCHDAWLDTHGFQARGFYEKLGYELFGELPDYPTPFARYFLRKRLQAPAKSGSEDVSR